VRFWTAAWRTGRVAVETYTTLSLQWLQSGNNHEKVQIAPKRNKIYKTHSDRNNTTGLITPRFSFLQTHTHTQKAHSISVDSWNIHTNLSSINFLQSHTATTTTQQPQIQATTNELELDAAADDMEVQLLAVCHADNTTDGADHNGALAALLDSHVPASKHRRGMGKGKEIRGEERRERKEERKEERR
jgi:hypothetical protein